MEMIKAQINGIPVEVTPGTTILNAAETVGVKIDRNQQQASLIV